MTDIEREERAIYIVILVALSPVLISLIYRGARAIDGGSVLALLIALCGVVGLASLARGSGEKLPRARALATSERAARRSADAE